MSDIILLCNMHIIMQYFDYSLLFHGYGLGGRAPLEQTVCIFPFLCRLVFTEMVMEELFDSRQPVGCALAVPFHK